MLHILFGVSLLRDAASVSILVNELHGPSAVMNHNESATPLTFPACIVKRERECRDRERASNGGGTWLGG